MKIFEPLWRCEIINKIEKDGSLSGMPFFDEDFLDRWISRFGGNPDDCKDLLSVAVWVLYSIREAALWGLISSPSFYIRGMNYLRWLINQINQKLEITDIISFVQDNVHLIINNLRNALQFLLGRKQESIPARELSLVVGYLFLKKIWNEHPSLSKLFAISFEIAGAEIRINFSSDVVINREVFFFDSAYFSPYSKSYIHHSKDFLISDENIENSPKSTLPGKILPEKILALIKPLGVLKFKIVYLQDKVIPCTIEKRSDGIYVHPVKKKTLVCFLLIV